MFQFFRTLLQKIKLKALARQLRKPTGTMGTRVGQMMNKANEFLYEATLDEMQIKGEESILEIGFGNGLFFSKIFEQAPNAKVIGLDYSASMVKEALALNQTFINTKNLKLFHGDSSKMPFADNSFDKIFCINVIYFWDNSHIHLQEIIRVLKPGGSFYATIRTKESMAMMPFTKYNFTCYTPEDWEKLLQENKLQPSTSKYITEPAGVFEGKPFQINSLSMKAIKAFT